MTKGAAIRVSCLQKSYKDLQLNYLIVICACRII